MEELIIECLYSPNDLIPIVDSLNAVTETLKVTLQELVKQRVYTEWLLGINVSLFALLIVIVFSIFFTNYK